ncbi:MAG: VOC family protein [Acidimicrobiia bacterium]
MSVAFDLVTIDSPDTNTLAAFYVAALGLTETEREDGDRWLVLAEADGTRRIGLQRGAHRPGGIHLDLQCDGTDFEAEVARLVELGASLASEPRSMPYGRLANLTDPDGNAIDVVAYR